VPVHRHCFQAMASPCEVQVDHPDALLARTIGLIAEAEARRIEVKFSRYRADSVIAQINNADGAPVAVDEETAELLALAALCHRISDGRFDITSGVLRRAWVFDGSDRVPDKNKVAQLLPLVGWQKVSWTPPRITLGPGMEIDFGGLGKEYAVDRAIKLIGKDYKVPVLVNFGGDLRVSGPRQDGSPWRVMIEAINDDPAAPGAWLEIRSGAITTSGDARRYIERAGVRYSHILDPRTGAPVRDAPRAVTVAAATCVEAGIASTVAMLNGRHAEKFLKREKIKAWVSR
jgi:thiamine biosynthesis lipoprotein